MRTAVSRWLCLVAALALGGCAASPAKLKPTGEVSADGLQRLSGTSFDELWVRPGLDLGSYPELLLEPARVSFRDATARAGGDLARLRGHPDGFPIPEDQRARIEERFGLRMTEALDQSSSYRRVAAPGPGVLRAQVALVDYVSSTPPDEPLVRSWVSSVGHATLLIELHDGASGALLARASSHDRAGPDDFRLIQANVVTSWSEIDRQMIRWGSQTRELLEQLYAQKL